MTEKTLRNFKDPTSTVGRYLDGFDGLVARAAPRALITLDLTRAAPKDQQEPAWKLSCSFGIPEKFETAQCLVFLRGVDREIYLLSTSEVMGGDIRFQRRATVPREDGRIDGRGPAAELRIWADGRLDLLALIVREDCCRLDWHPIFRDLNPETGRSDELKSIDVIAFTSLSERISRCAQALWSIAHKRFSLPGA